MSHSFAQVDFAYKYGNHDKLRERGQKRDWMRWLKRQLKKALTVVESSHFYLGANSK